MKITRFSSALALGFLFLFNACQRPASKLQTGGSIVKEGFMDCFQSGLQAAGKEVWCEASAVLNDGSTLSIANDKDMPGTDASVFYWAYAEAGVFSSKPTYLTQNLFKTSQKYEDFALTPDH